MKKLPLYLLIVLSIISCKGNFTPTPQKCVVTFDSDGGNKIPYQEVEQGHTVTEPVVPVKKDCIFSGWYIEDTLFDFSTPITSDITLKAKWNKKSFTVTFDSDGGSKITTQVIEINNTVTKPENPSKEDYVFLGWFFEESLFDFSTPVTTNINLKAKWNKKTFTVTFDYDDGNALVFQEVEIEKTITKPIDPIKNKYKFIRWFNGCDEFDFSTPIISNIELKAKWEKTIFIVTFDFDGVRNNLEKEIEKGHLITSEDAPWEKHRFQGWFYGDTEFDFSTPINTDITLKAKWIKICTVIFDYENGNKVEKNLEEGELLETPSDPVKENCSFAGWFY